MKFYLKDKETFLQMKKYLEENEYLFEIKILEGSFLIEIKY